MGVFLRGFAVQLLPRRYFKIQMVFTGWNRAMIAAFICTVRIIGFIKIKD
jgi:hypothetical protein